MVGRSAIVAVTLLGCSSSPAPRTAQVTTHEDTRDAQLANVKTTDASTPPADLYEACRADLRQACDALAALCDGGDGTSCAKLGNVYWLASGAMRDEVKARALFARACVVPSGPFDGCVELAEIDCRSDDHKRQRDAITTLDRACASKAGRACAFAGLLYTEGLCEVPYNAGAWSLGVRYYEQACDLGNVGGCTHLGLLVRAGHGVTKNETRGQQLLLGACARGDTVACDYAKQQP